MRINKSKQYLLIMMMAIAILVMIPAAGFAASIPVDSDSDEIEQLEDLVVACDNEGNEVSLQNVDEDSYDGFIYVLKDNVKKADLKSMKKEIDAIDDETVVDEVFGDYIFKAESLDVIEEITDPEMIDYIEPDYYTYAVQEPSAETVSADDGTIRINSNDTYYSYNAWAYNMMGMSNVWNKGVKGTGKSGGKTPTVAILDTGLRGSMYSSRRHEDINYSKMVDAVYLKSYGSCEDGDGHGTFVTGEICAIMDNGKGVTGLMPDVNIIPCKVLGDDGTGSVSSSESAISYLLENFSIDVINMSLGSEYKSTSFQSVINTAAQQGVIVVAAAGNEAQKGNPLSYPACYNNVISVASVDSSESRAYYSNYNSYVDVAAPGSQIAGLYITSNASYGYMSGTSMACPMVAAMAAMAKSLDKSMTHDKFMTVIRNTSVDKGTSGKDNYYGYGIANFANAYNYITGGTTPTPSTPTTPDPVPTPVGDMSMTVYGGPFTYTGSAIKPSVGVTASVVDTQTGSSKIVSLIEGTDYSLSYKNNINAGTATAVATGKGTYSGQIATANFTIKAQSITSFSIPKTEYEYTGNAIEPAVTVQVSGKTLIKGTDYTVTYSNNTKVGTASVKVTGKGNYQGTVTKNFKITAQSLYSISLDDYETYVYNGSAFKPQVTVRDSNWNELKENTDYTLTYRNNINAGTATVTAKGKGNYTGTVKETFEIEKAESELDFESYNASYKAKSLKKKKQFKAIDVTSHNGVISYSAKGINKKSKKALKFKSSTPDDDEFFDQYLYGWITVSKGTKKGTYKMKVTVTDSGDQNHYGSTMTMTITVKVK